MAIIFNMLCKIYLFLIKEKVKVQSNTIKQKQYQNKFKDMLITLSSKVFNSMDKSTKIELQKKKKREKFKEKN